MSKSETAVRLKQEIITAMKAKDKERLTVLRMLSAAVKQVEVDTREELDEEGVIKVVRSHAKKVKDAMQGARDAGRDEMVAQNEAELALVGEFLPAELADAVIETLVREAIDEEGATSMKDMGKVIKATMVKVAGRADGGRISGMVKRLLAGS